MAGHNVSHAHNLTKRTWNPNLQRVRALALDPLHALPRQQLEWRELLAVNRQEPPVRP